MSLATQDIRRLPNGATFVPLEVPAASAERYRLRARSLPGINISFPPEGLAILEVVGQEPTELDRRQAALWLWTLAVEIAENDEIVYCLTGCCPPEHNHPLLTPRRLHPIPNDGSEEP